jgi:hypothetical protein
MQTSEIQTLRTEQDLLNCGFSEESINSIRNTTVITRDGAQHVVPTSQSYLQEERGAKPQQQTSIVETDSARLAQQFDDQQRMFSRFKQYTDGRIMTLERGLTAAQEIIKDLQNKMLTMKSNHQAQSYEDAPVKQPSKPLDKAIDRNKVAPADVQVDKIFYCGDR